MFRITTTLIVAALAYAAALVPAFAEKRVALVFGNSAYRNAPALKNPHNDAADMARSLRRLGFKVIEGLDLDRRAMEARIRDFAAEVEDAEVGLFYYAGHGLQVNGTNYLAPVDASLKAEADLDFEAVPLNLVMRQLQRSTRVGLLFLDACRDNPLARSLGQAGRSLQIGRGLAAVEKAAGTLIAFATQPGNVALDGEGRNSPFTRALLKHIETPDATINDVMIEVRKDVMEATNKKQVPWENSSLTGKFYFKTRSLAGAETTPAPTTTGNTASVIKVADTAIEHTFWTAVQESNDPKLYQAYLRRFPNGVYRPIAEAKLRSMRSIAVEANPEFVKPAAPAPKKVAQLQPATLTDVQAVQPPIVPIDPRSLAMRQQAELKRVGCYNKAIDGIWGAGSTAAMSRFNQYAKAALPTHAPDQSVIAVIAQHQHRVCPVLCPAGTYLAKSGQCLAVKPRTLKATHRAKPRRKVHKRRTVRHRPRVVHEAPVHRPRPSFSLSFSKGLGSGGRVGFGIRF